MNSSGDSSEVDYEVECIMGKRSINGRIFYLIKWKNYSVEDNTWEPLENLSCEELIKEYEAEHSTQSKPKKIKRKRKSGERIEYLVEWSDHSETWTSEEFCQTHNLDKLISEFEKEQLKRKRPKLLKITNVDCITDMIRENGEVFYMVKYKNSDDTAWIPMEIVKENHPQKVIEFYEKCITWEK